MPPILPRKRFQSDSPPAEPPPKRERATRNAPVTAKRNGKEAVFQALDTPPILSRTLSEAKAFLEQDESELSNVESDSDEFEDVDIDGKSKDAAQEAEDSAEEDWEDALGQHHNKHDDEPAPVISGDLQLTFSADTAAQAAYTSKPDGKKGPSKVGRHIRNVTHCMHVQFLMVHNLMRNGWIQDKEVQRILVENLSAGCWKEIDRYWRNAGITDGPQRVVKGGWTKKTAKAMGTESNWKDTGRNGVKEFTPSKKHDVKAGASKSKSKDKGKESRSSDRNQREWGATSDRLEPGTPNLSAGDPLIRLLKYLAAYWRGRFKTTSTSLRKRGYLSPFVLREEIDAWKEDPLNADAFGERVEDLAAFRELARKCEGSKDIGQQLFTALVRGLGVEARMVASLQPVGFGWSQVEEGKPKNITKIKERNAMTITTPSKKSTPEKGKVAKGKSDASADDSDDEDSDLSSIISISSESEPDAKPKKSLTKARSYGNDLPHPTYWTEAISHLTHTPIAVSPLPRTMIATSSTPDAMLDFYCRGAAAEKAKQVFAYLIAFSSDGTAKDVTTRYLAKNQWPGKTKGFRMGIERVPIYNKRGKVKKWEEFDWFKSVMRPYARHHIKRQPWDEIEDEGDLVPKQPEKKKEMDEEGGRESLQGYKNSTEYVLERHLRREEALKPGAKTVRYFVTGKGDNEKKEPVYRRKDIVSCKTVESWHKEGRAVKEGEQPLKMVPMRVVTVARKREIEERERVEGEKVKQGLYSKAQTDWIIPNPIKDGKIPRNAFGNIDVYVPTMIPKGAVHIPLRGTVRVCKKLNIDFAEACTGFEFGKQRAVPVLTGVVVAAENEDLVIDAWEVAEEEKKKKEAEKKEKLILSMWKKFAVGLRIVERMKREYGDDIALPPAEKTKKTTTASNKPESKKSEWDTFNDYEGSFEGGFVREEPGTSKPPAGGFLPESEDMPGGFFPASQEEPAHRNIQLTIDHGSDEESAPTSVVTDGTHRMPISLHSAHQTDGDIHQTNGEAREDEENDDVPLVPTSRAVTTTRTRGKARAPRAPGSTRKVSTTRKTSIVATEDDESLSLLAVTPSASESEASSDNDDEDDADFGQPTKGKRKAANSPAPTRAAPKRKAARKSEEQVKSHFFAHGSGDETDLTDRSPRKSGKGGTGGRVRGRGRGRGRKSRG
jgi:xeroderma pigmentosum group C-complementing protein